jgi:lipid-A-disaccharide synthase
VKVAIVAGETSGDTLGAAFITALRTQHPQARFFGMAGPRMIAAGCEAWAHSDDLGVMGLVEVLTHLPRLLRLRNRLLRRIEAARPDVFVGIDVPDFNLGLAKRLKRAGIRTVQYVSPQVWAWRQGRVKSIGRSVDLVLCLLPFETEFYAKHGVQAQFVGHPLADQIPLEVDRAGARRALGIASEAVVVALLPGSRLGEVERLGPDFVAAAQWLRVRRPDVEFIAPMVSERVRAVFERHSGAMGQSGVLPVRLLDGQAQAALAAADAVLVASGTATLETLLSKRPMVVAYRLGAVTAFLLRHLGLIKVPYFSQPNLLVGRRLVPEFFQSAVTGPALGAALLEEIDNASASAQMIAEFERVHRLLRRDGAALAASAVLKLAGAARA